ncbi:uncharacterized protein LOC131847113 [Achroia grisella]|uniref:uncharacterized protein LOC131847113 n=1 Tax=Achroia grisella TaxID=688607 RepID=UPI0027D30622|nr:uncharacterized protein LOC131847113 [Achroia grisella]
MECGPHGRFEYCIDGIPGCVVGCHCHPGYYFDTETKVCEPNVKLTKNFRRIYMSEPTRIPALEFTTPNANDPTPTTNKELNDKVDAITKDADDLGDWLYNQFFKTIENQVINKSESEPLTRRSGNSHSNRVSKRKVRKFGKKSLKRKRKSKKGLRKKLLRITEDDSLFHSSSSAEDLSSSYSDSSSYESESDEEHGHRKIVMINKKPTPPLPSFIFLPNMDTPFYPPIGLPPPPIIPMYPMVPVPPMSPPYTGFPKPEVEKISKTEQTTPNTNGETSTTTRTSSHTTASTEFTQPAPENSERSNKENLHRRKEFLKKIREKMKRRNKIPLNQITDTYREENLQAEDDSFLEEPFSYNEIKSRADDVPKIEDVDFKYLTQLIHRVDFNKNKTRNENQYQENTSKNMLEFYKPVKYQKIPNYRRVNLNTYKAPIAQLIYPEVTPEPRRYLSKTDDSYYSNLGRQIASLIRKLDNKGERQINIEIKQENHNNQKDTVFNENRYAPRSYWERSIRSLYINLHPNANKSDYNGDGNENLYNLENQVVAATTTSSLSLQELENVISMMKRAQSHVQYKKYELNNNITSNINLNRNLFPRGVRKSNKPIKYVAKPKSDYSNKTQYVPMLHHGTPNISNIKGQNLRVKFRNEPGKNILIPIRNEKNINTKLPIFLKRAHNSDLLINHSLSEVDNLTERKVVQNNMKHIYQLDPIILNHKKLNYYSYNDQYGHLPNLPRQLIKTYGKPRNPSYFHHELHHFDYFD